ncbi:acetyltransferase [Paractinoplanes abujensis]|uniref:RimJ/RimL family protein N-acetyltransferase n=1 Tax=Paractinoplanes abujensis TaxID=882441 RepID=A0A7W7CQ83_9ACTN|nr:GNAT family N-acetyltransferase [Actinoplanes abujensis]MBB4691248.1 RimJ/RimL family protein N-acetyltransferase [Actinoplanes abujensis]GID17337.1 acetyltransferase [Actinoplanes abujensis]
MTAPRIIPPTIPSGRLAARPQPTLTTSDGLVLRPWRTADAPVFLAAYQDPAIQRWHGRIPASEDEVRTWFEQYREGWQQERGASWAVTRDGDEVLGRMALGQFDLHEGNAVFAYWVLPAARGSGVAPRALAAVSAWAFGEAGFHRVELSHSTRNNASCRVAVKAGFALEGTKRSEAVHADGLRHDMHLHARIRGDG